MEKLTMLGTGHAMTTECFNTCFVYENENGKLLVDTGGGQQLVGRLRQAGISGGDIGCVFLTHRHTDHVLGLPWLVRMRRESKTPLEVVAHRQLCRIAEELLRLMFPQPEDELGRKVTFRPVEDGEEIEICGRSLLCYDTHSPTCPQFGFAMTLGGGGKFVFNGDVPYHPANRATMEHADFLMHEAFCLSAEQTRPRAGHSSVAQAARYAEELAAGTLILVHGSDRDLPRRREAYTREAAAHFHGDILVPYDLETIRMD